MNTHLVPLPASRLCRTPHAPEMPSARAGLLFEHAERIWAYSSDIYELVVGRDEEVILIVTGDGDTDLDLFVYDSRESLVDFDARDCDRCVAHWVTDQAAVYRVEVHNLGGVFNDYRISVLRKRRAARSAA